MSLIIGFTGGPSAGKDTSASHLVKNYGFTRLAFADPIREAVLALNPWIEQDVRLSHVVNREGWDTSKNKYPEVRRLLQIMGTEVGRDLHGQNVWIEKLLQSIDAMPKHKRIAVTDVRFQDEVDALRKRGAFIIRVSRTSAHSREVVMSHRSEVESAEISPNYFLPNNSSIEELHRRLDRLVSRKINKRSFL